MKKIIIIPIIFLLSISIAHAETKEISSARPQLTITYTPSIQEIEDIALLVAQTTPYDVLKYNCWDYATDLKLELAKNGYKSKIVFGIVNCSSGLFDEQICKQFGGVHTWIEIDNIWVEATSGKVITDRTPYKMGYYGVMKYNPYKKAWKEANK